MKTEVFAGVQLSIALRIVSMNILAKYTAFGTCL